jgi:steroid delta-isomerase-like uncharacterized protein
MTSEQNKDIVRRFWKAYETNDQVTLNTVLAPDLIAHAAGSPEPQNREQHLQGITMFNTAFSDRRFTVNEMIAEGDTVATRTTIQGIHSGVFQGIAPSGKRISTTGLTIERIQDGKIFERWFSFDVAGVMRELASATPS